MSFERYKTQVLLLHSEQNTLDALSAGFDDDYCVHCETSGADALTTLGDTPIHVIVAAQDLPGMSGLDALREATKRSPETFGILLAGADKDGKLAARVGDKEGIRIVRGTVTPESLLQLVESAIRDILGRTTSGFVINPAAPLDDPVFEHIVVETSEHGQTIISDGSGPKPVLQRKNTQNTSDAAGKGVDILLLTTDKEFLATVSDSARGLHNVFHASTQKQAMDYARDNDIRVLVTDVAIAKSGIEALTHKLRTIRPRMVAVVAGRRDDGEMLMDLINRGHVYRFLLKPVSPGRARLAIEASVKHHHNAPDSAFRPKSTATSAATKATGKKAAKSGRKSAARATTANERQTGATSTRNKTISPVNGDLDGAFEADGKLVEAMSDIGASPGKTASHAATGAVGGAVALLRSPKTLAVAGGTLAMMALAAWLTTSQDPMPAPVDVALENPAATPAIVESDVTYSTPVPDPVLVAEPVPAVPATAEPVLTVYQILLDTARAARDAGNLVEPAGANAVVLYMIARQEAPGDPTIEAELETVVTQVLGLAATAILEQDAGRAIAALALVRQASPQNSRITFLDAQLTKLEMQAKLDEARVAIREVRFEDAERLISEAGSLVVGDRASLNLATLELSAARNRSEVAGILATASEKVTSGWLLSPPEDNARFYYELALSKDPGNQAALQGLTIVASTLALQARDAIDQGRLDEAEDLLRIAGPMDPSSTELRASSMALATAREALAEAARQAEAVRVAELEKQAELERQAELARLAELEKQAELGRQAELARLAELEKQAELGRQAEIERQAQIERLAILEREAAIERQAELKRQAKREQQAELTRLAEIERQAEQARLAVIARHEEEARRTELREAQQQASEQHAAVAATSSLLGVAGSTVKTPVRVDEPIKPAPPPNIVAAARVEPSPAPGPDTTVAATENGADNALPGISRQSQAPVSLPQFGSAVIDRVGELSDNGGGNEPVADELIAISTLVRTSYVQPIYPRAAQRRNISGSVEIEFTVDPNGIVTDVLVTRAEPADTFNQAAMDAVEKWRFEPVVENGHAVSKRTAVRLSFDLK